jgi:hypothetical protein
MAQAPVGQTTWTWAMNGQVSGIKIKALAFFKSPHSNPYFEKERTKWGSRVLL